MKIFNFIKQLLPSIEKREVLEDLRIAISDLETNILPSYNTATDFLSSNKPKSPAVIELGKEFYKHLSKNGISKQKTMVGDINLRLIKYLDVLKYVQDELSDVLEEDVLNEGLTANKATLIRTASLSLFINRYASSLLNYIYSLEENELSSDDFEPSPQLTKYINKNLRRFTYTLSDYGIAVNTFKSTIARVPEVIVNDANSSSVKAVYNADDLDPFTSSTKNLTVNPIYHIRMSIAQWQINRYKEAKEKKKVLELRLLHLKTLQEGQEDAKLQTEIDYNQSRLDKISRKIADVEAELE